MVRFMDELHGSIGERVTVAGYGDTRGYEGSIEALHDFDHTVDVRFDDGTVRRIGIAYVTFLTDEDEADA